MGKEKLDYCCKKQAFAAKCARSQALAIRRVLQIILHRIWWSGSLTDAERNEAEELLK
jgi:hypothetical protein